RVAFPSVSTKGRLHLSGRFLWLEDPKLELPCTTGPLELKPELRGALQGHISLAAEAEAHRSAFAGLRFKLWSKTWNLSKDRVGPSPDAEVDATGDFLVEAMPAASDWELTLPAGEFLSIRRSGIGVELGKLAHCDLAAQ